ncbi:MarR family transcriptional regulator [Seohaeicola saemankumensis]|nr:MarR family transcriptional regulator [Seohaeicola saemankumensis]MCA0873011.1 MarR family transcriptional regulator [Seohaeicola saemankumensis]
MSDTNDPQSRYFLDEQVGFILRRANQRHLGIFASHIPDLTPTQFAALAKLCELGQTTQNALGRATAMDAATIKGVVDRLRRKGLVESTPDLEDQRRLSLSPSDDGRALFALISHKARTITAETLAPLNQQEQQTLLALLNRLT